ncbi:extracellular solute-binding protein [Streptomyces sp. ST2-7A]|uniref:extracellular solute-binding protein n=1 Tax=Streptomyces sp. ST2-7A TaxID=2907214 RepID=UPI001F3374CB|nr:extracellular solute-binding protein [Streptomyces sp. ST2-7A]MCE7081578.1 extracellular solute-binding protein [Streptomyces sp. ST2-7A]
MNDTGDPEGSGDTGNPGNTGDRLGGRRPGRDSRRAVPAGAALLVTVLALLPLAACGAGDSGPEAEPVSGSITFWDTSNETEAPVFNQLVAAFQREHPGIDVDHVSVPFFEAEERYLDAVGTGSAPDVLRADVGWTAHMVAGDLLADLTGTPAEPAPEEFLETAVDSVLFGDAVYGAPQVTDTLALMYNKDLFDRAGLTRPPRYWSETQAYGLTVAEATDAEGIVLNTDGYFALPFLHGEDTDLIDPDARTITIAGDAAVRGISAAASLVESGAAPAPPEKDAYEAMQGAFKRGEAAMMINGPWAVADLLDSPVFADGANLGIAPVPAGTGGSAGSPTGGHNLVVSAGTPNATAAQLFVSFMTAAEQQEKVALELGLLPTRKAAYTDAVLADPVRNAFYFAHTKAVPRTPLPAGSRMFADLQEVYTDVLRGGTTPADGMADLALDWQGGLLNDHTVATAGASGD